MISTVATVTCQRTEGLRSRDREARLALTGRDEASFALARGSIALSPLTFPPLGGFGKAPRCPPRGTLPPNLKIALSRSRWGLALHIRERFGLKALARTAGFWGWRCTLRSDELFGLVVRARRR